jgi:phosphonate transport system permease protein
LTDRRIQAVRLATPYLALGTGLVVAVTYIASATDWDRVATPAVALENLRRFFPPNFAAIPGLLQPTLDTLLMALFSTLLIAILAPVVVWLSAANISPNRFTVMLGRSIVVCSRSIHELVWGLLFVIAVGLGPLAGILALGVRGIGFVAKIVAEEVEDIDKKPIEALRAAGVGPLRVLILAVIPQILPIYVGTLVFQCELDLRRAAVIGVVGAGGLGLAFQQAMMQYNWSDAMAIVVILVFIVGIGEVISRQVRKRII